MFQYQSTYREKASGKAVKIIFLTILAALFMVLSTSIIMGVFTLPVLGFYDSPWVILYILLGVFFFFLLSIFLLYPMSLGIIRFFTKAYNNEPFGFGELFYVFKEGRYGKAVKITIIVVVLYFIFSFVMGFIANMIYLLVNAPLSAMGLFAADGSLEETWVTLSAQIGLVVIVMVLNLIVTILIYIPYILVSLYIGLIYLTYTDQPMIPTMDKFKIAWDVMFKSGESILRLFFSNVLLSIGLFVLYFVIMIGSVFIGIMIDSPGTMIALLIAGAIVFFITYIYTTYVIVGSVVAFYFTGRDKLDAQAGEINTDEHYENELEQL